MMENNTKKLKNIKFIHHPFMSGEVYTAGPLEVSIELRQEPGSGEWGKFIKGEYVASDERPNESVVYKQELDFDEGTLSELEKLDLAGLKNNYFTDAMPERFSRWELEYNYYFKIVGTFDQMPEEVRKVRELLSFEDAEKDMDEMAKTNLELGI